MSKRKKEITPALVKHRHCIVCGVSTDADKRFCGSECEKEFEKESKRRKMMSFVWIATFVGLMLLLTLLRTP